MNELASNRKALHDFEILNRFEAGLELTGHEAKAIRTGKLNLRGAFVDLRGGEAYLLNAELPPYQEKNAPQDYEPKRARRLLLSKNELEELAQVTETKGLTIVPLAVYNKGRFLKVDVAVARGKRQFDKRESIKKRDTERELKRTL